MAGALAGLVASALFWAWYLQTVPLVLSQPYGDGTVAELREGESFQQSFIAHYPGLNEVAVRTVPSGEVRPDGIEFNLIAHLESGAEIAVSAEEAQAHLRDDGWLAFTFAPQPHSPPTEYSMVLENTGVEPVAFRVDRRDLYPVGSLEGGTADLAFEARFDPAFGARLSGLLTRLAAGKPGLFGLPLFYPVAGILMTSSLVGMLSSLYLSWKERS